MTLLGGFMRSRWRGQVPVHRLYWRDMVLVGSFINLLTSFMALMVWAQGGKPGVAVAIHFATLPYNVFLVAALWRTPQCGKVMRWSSVAWLGLMTVV